MQQQQEQQHNDAQYVLRAAARMAYGSDSPVKHKLAQRLLHTMSDPHDPSTMSVLPLDAAAAACQVCNVCLGVCVCLCAPVCACCTCCSGVVPRARPPRIMCCCCRLIVWVKSASLPPCPSHPLNPSLPPHVCLHTQVPASALLAMLRTDSCFRLKQQQSSNSSNSNSSNNNSCSVALNAELLLQKGRRATKAGVLAEELPPPVGWVGGQHPIRPGG